MKRPILGIFLLCATAMAWPYLANSSHNLDKVLESQQERVSDDPRNPAAWNDLGNLLALEDRFAEAEQAYRQALALTPTDTSARFNLALLLQQGGRQEEAENELSQVLDLDSHHAWAHYQMGVIKAGRRDRVEAIEHYARALAYNTNLAFAKTNPHILDNPLFGEALLRSQKYQKSSAIQVPRQYSETERLVNIMLDEEKELMEEEKRKGEKGDESDEDEEGDEEDEGGGKSASQSAGRSRTSLNSSLNTAPSTKQVTGSTREDTVDTSSRPLTGTTVGRPRAGSTSTPNRRQVAEQDREELAARGARGTTSQAGRTPPPPVPEPGRRHRGVFLRVSQPHFHRPYRTVVGEGHAISRARVALRDWSSSFCRKKSRPATRAWNPTSPSRVPRLQDPA